MPARTDSAARLLPTLLLLATGSAALPAAGTVYRCQSDGAPVFTQFCAPADRIHRGAAPGKGAFLRFEPLTREEREVLDALSRELAATRRRAEQQRLKTSRQAQTLRARAAERCARARQALQALEERRRRGYGAREGRALSRRERELHAERKANC